MSVIWLLDRSRVVAREECPRMRYLQYDYQGTGADTESGSLPLLSGIAIHAAHARLLVGESIDKVVTEIIGEYRNELQQRGLLGLDVTQELIREQSALLEGMLRLWTKFRLPMLLEEYEVIEVEKQWVWLMAPGIGESIRFDAVLRRKADGLLFLLDFKTLSYPSEMWADKFIHDHQTCLYLQALKEKFPEEEVGGIIYEGLVKGLFKKETAKSSPWYGSKVQHSPYTVAYMVETDGVKFFQTDYTAKKEYRKVRPYDHMTVKEWVDEWLPPSVAETLFVVLPEIMPPDYELLEVKEQVIREELEYREKLLRFRAMPEGVEKEKFLDILAPKRRQRCFKYGQDNRCPYVDSVCFNYGSGDLFENGFTPRKPHHDTDMKVAA